MNSVTYWIVRAKLAALALLNPWRTVRQLREENERLAKAITDPLLTGIHMGNGSLWLFALEGQKLRVLLKTRAVDRHEDGESPDGP